MRLRIKSKSENDERKARIAALRDAGVKGRKVQTLLTLPWLTVEYIKAHWAQVQKEQWDNPVGMMIYRMEGEDPAPDVYEAKIDYRRETIDRGKRGKETIVYDFDVEQHIADFMKHEKRCDCIDCRMLLSAHGDTRIICDVCKHHECTCEESEE